MGSDQKQDDSEKIKIIFGKLLDKAELPIRAVISVFDSVQSRSAVVKKFDQFTVPQLESCAEFLGITLADKDSFKIFTKPTLIERIYLGLRALLPATCKECGEGYVVDHEPQVPPYFSCFRCFRGSHDCERNRLLHQTLVALNTPSGFVWLCDKCLDVVDPIGAPRKQRARYDSGNSHSAGNQTSDADLSKLAAQALLSSTHNSAQAVQDLGSSSNSQDLPHDPGATPRKLCNNFLNWKCPHGMSGKKLVDGKSCQFLHPRVCNQFRVSGSTGKSGCKKGKECSYFHPAICKTVLSSGSCSTKDCAQFHPRSARKKPPSRDSDKAKSVPRNNSKRNQNSATANQKSSDSKSNDFLELRNLVTGMATKLEALEKRMSEGVPACLPAAQPISQAPPAQMYPAPTHPHMLPLGMQRIPHPMSYSHLSYY